MLQKLKEELVTKTTKIDILKDKKLEIEKEIEKEEKELSKLQEQIKKMHEKLSLINARDKKIYTEKVLLGWSNNKISANNYGITRQHIIRIVKKVDRELMK